MTSSDYVLSTPFLDSIVSTIGRAYAIIETGNDNFHDWHLLDEVIPKLI